MAKPPLKVADLFCGAGGTSLGLSRACLARGRPLDLVALNHWPTAVETHAANHPGARHLCESLDNVDPRHVVPGRKLDLLVASPECTHHSTARGGKPCDDQSRATAWHVVRWADALRPRVILVENVQEFRTWGPLSEKGRPLKRRKGETFRAWLAAIESLGYRVGHQVLNSADYGAATTRRRLFVLAVRGPKTGPLPWPEATHAKEAGGLFPLPRWRAAREVIDWANPGVSIFGRKRPLSPNTLFRIEAGLRRFGGAEAEPFLLLLRGTSLGHLNASARDLGGPLPTLAAQGEHMGLVQPFAVHCTHHGEPRVHDLGDPAPTVTGANRGELGLVQPFVLQMSQTGSNGSRMRPDGDPLPTITTADDLSIVRPFLIPANYGERPTQTPRTHDLDAPLPTVVGTGSHAVVRPFLVPYYGTGEADSIDDPARTLTAKDRLGLVTPAGRPDILFRMLTPRELARAQGFPDDYQFRGNRTEIVKQVGNAVEVCQAEALAGAILDRLFAA